MPKHSSVFNGFYNCSVLPPYVNVTNEQMYKTQKNLLYPVNVGRNIARETAQTHYILPSDIELYPSGNVITQFLSMISENKGWYCLSRFHPSHMNFPQLLVWNEESNIFANYKEFLDQDKAVTESPNDE